MNHRNDDDRLDEIISQAVDIGKVEFDRAKWLSRVSAKPQRKMKVWRTIMESKVTRYSAAAVVALAAAVVLIQPDKQFGNQGVVLAEVAKKVNEMDTSIGTCSRTIWYQGQEEPCLKAEATVYVSSKHGYVEEQHDADGNLTHRAYILKEPRRFLLVAPAEKKYMETSMSEDIFGQITATITPGGLLDRITAGPHIKLGRRQSDGREVEGFGTNDPDVLSVPRALRFLFPVNNITAQVWIDVESSLPVELQVDFTTDRGLLTGFRKLRAEFRTHDIQWNAELPEGIFDPNIPEDYTPVNLESAAKENAAWLGVGAVPIVGIIVHRRRRRRRSGTCPQQVSCCNGPAPGDIECGRSA